MAEETNLEKCYLEEYWNRIKKRPGICVTRRESVKNSIIYYDLKREFIFAGDAWQRMCQYKLANGKYDCDVSYLVMLQYAIAFPHVRRNGWEIQKQPYGQGIKFQLTGSEFKYRGDTMNSYATTVHRYLNFAVEQGRVNWEICMLDPHQCLNSIISEDARLFIELNHTIGNFVPVPFVKEGEEFNRPRGKGATKDYWDLALLAIYQWYTQGNVEALQKMLNSEENTKLCITWLRKFENKTEEKTQIKLKSWDNFVEKNYMQPFVKPRKDSEHFGPPKELWNGHFSQYKKEITGAKVKNAEKSLRKKQKQFFEEYFQNVSMWILARGEQIAEAIMLKLEKTPGCHPWKEDD